MIPNFATSKGIQWIKYIILVLIIGVVISLTGFVISCSPQTIFLITSLLFIVSGVCYWRYVKKQASATEQFISWLIKISALSYFFLLAGYLSGFFLFSTFLEKYFISSSFIWMIAVSSVLSVVPLLFEFIFESVVSIPPPDYKKWIYPEKTLVMDMDNIDLSNFAVITFVFSKKFGDKSTSNFQSKAPYPIKLGDLFYFFIQEWNHKNPGNTIEYMTESAVPFGWYFTMKKSWWKPKFYLDPDLSIRENNIKVNEIVKTERVSLST